MKKAHLSELRFSLLDEESLQQRSVVNFKPNREQTTRRNTVLIGSVMDPRFGSITPSVICSTCGSSAEKCQGHVGTLKLKIPCPTGIFTHLLHKILTCVCVRCSRLLIPKTTPKVARLLSGQEQTVLPKSLNELALIASRSKLRVCGDASDGLLSPEESERRGYCGAIQPVQWVRFEMCLVRPVWPPGVPVPLITGHTVYNIIKNISPENSRILGFNPPYAPVTAVYTGQMLIPPMLMRPSRSMNVEDDLTFRLRNIIRANDLIGDTLTHNLSMLQSEHDDTFVELDTEPPYPTKPRHTRHKKPVVPYTLSEYFDLARNVTGFADNRNMPKLENDYGRERCSVRHRFAATKSRPGNVRDYVLGKRGDFNGRGVASPDTYMNVDEVGIPIHVCMNITVSEKVTVFNYQKMFELVKNGPNVYPGATQVKRGLTTYLTTGCMGGLRVGDTVCRHLLKGDMVIMNRQPSLHRYSLMIFKVVPHRQHTIKSHLNITPALNLDYDGDEVNFFVLYDLPSRAEAQELMAVGKNLFKDGHLLVSFVQHACLGVYKLTQEGVQLTREEVGQLAMCAGYEPLFQKILQNVGPVQSGREFFSWILPAYKPAKHGVMNKKKLNALMGIMIRNIWNYDNTAIEYMSAITRVLEEFVVTAGCSLSLACCTVEIPEDVKATIRTMRQKVIDFESISSERTRNHSQFLKDTVEENVCKLLDQTRDYVGEYVLQRFMSRKRSNLLDVVMSGAKGNLTHITQNAAAVGSQLDVYSKRPVCYPNIEAFDMSAKRGFIQSSFVDGLNSLEAFHHLAASRVGLVGTAVSTSETGYCYRRISKCLEDLRVEFDNSVRDAQGNLVMYLFGFDTSYLQQIKINIMDLTVEELVQRYRTEDSGGAEEVSFLLDLRRSLLRTKYLHRHTPVPVDFELMEAVVRQAEPLPLVDNATIRQVVSATWKRLVVEFHVNSGVWLKSVFFERLSTAELRRIGLVSLPQLRAVVAFVSRKLAENVMSTGTPIGLIASQSFAEPLTQMQLNRFHYSGEASELTSGVSRIKELLNLSKKIMTPSMEIYLNNEDIQPMELIQLRLKDIVVGWTDRAVDEQRELLFRQRLGAEEEEGGEGEAGSTVRVVLYLNRDRLIQRRISPRMVASHLVSTKELEKENNAYRYISFSELSDECWYVCIALPYRSSVVRNIAKFNCHGSVREYSSSSNEMLALILYHKLLHCNRMIAGVAGIRDFFTKNVEVNAVENNVLVKQTRKVIVTLGTNLSGICSRKSVDVRWTTTNDISEIYQTLGIDAATKAIENNLVGVMLSNAASVSRAHIKIIATYMCVTGRPCALTFSGLVHANASALKLSLFERSLNSFIGAGTSGHIDNLRGISEATMAGTRVSVGTGGDFKLIKTCNYNVVPRVQNTVQPVLHCIRANPGGGGIPSLPEVSNEIHAMVNCKSNKKKSSKSKNPTYRPSTTKIKKPDRKSIKKERKKRKLKSDSAEKSVPALSQEKKTRRGRKPCVSTTEPKPPRSSKREKVKGTGRGVGRPPSVGQKPKRRSKAAKTSTVFGWSSYASCEDPSNEEKAGVQNDNGDDDDAIGNQMNSNTSCIENRGVFGEWFTCDSFFVPTSPVHEPNKLQTVAPYDGEFIPWSPSRPDDDEEEDS